MNEILGAIDEQWQLLGNLSYPQRENDFIVKWDFIEIKDDRPVRIYYKPDFEGLGHGFMFHIVSWVTRYIQKDDKEIHIWDNTTFVNTMYWGISCFDGIRHFYMGNGNEKDGIEGYQNYPDINVHIKALIELKKLEAKYCRDASKLLFDK